jgi:small multidrug resistance pump
MTWIYLCIAIVAEVIATSFLKLSDGFTRAGPSVLVVLGYGFAFFFLSLALRTIPVGVAYAVWAGAGIMLVTLIGWLAFDQRLDAAGFLGIGLILSGVLVLRLFSTGAAS